MFVGPDHPIVHPGIFPHNPKAVALATVGSHRVCSQGERAAPGSVDGRGRGGLSVSRDFLDQHIRHELRVIRRGRKVLVSIRELERWLEQSAALTLERDR